MNEFLLIVLTVVDLITLSLLKYRARAQSVCPCMRNNPPDGEQ